MATRMVGGIPEHRPRGFGHWAKTVGWRHGVGVIALLFAAFPLLYMVSAAFNPVGTLSSTSLIPTQFSLENFSKLLSGEKGPFTRWYLNTLIICSVVAIGQVFFSTLAAYAFSRFRFQGRRMGLLSLLLIMMFPQFLSVVAIFTMFSEIGKVIPAIGLNTMLGYIVVMLGGALGNVWLIKGFFDTVPREIDEAAIVDGCTHWQVFHIMILPLVRPILATTVLLSFVGVINEFILAGVFLTDTNSKTLAAGMFGLIEGDRSNNMGIFAAGAVLTVVPVVALFQYLQKYIVGGVTAGAVKG
ncbi:MAG: sugar ABC transporter permease [Propionibacteriaceae bacterium]|nr:sugar ABC transporter permease [Propionibacteriaceae bacterium]